VALTREEIQVDHSRQASNLAASGRPDEQIASPPDWDPLAADVLENQQAANDNMRAKCPVAHSEFLGTSVFRYDDIVAVTRDPETFSNDVPPPTVFQDRGKSIPLNLDPPQHTVYRQLLNPYFSARRMFDFEPTARKLAIALMEPLISTGEGEMVEAFAGAYPIQSLCAFLGWDAGDWRQIKTWASDLERAAVRNDPALGQRTWNAWKAYIESFISARRSEPREDVTSWLLEEEREGAPLGDEVKVSILRLLLHAGHGTTAASVAICVLYLARNPNLQDQLRAAPNLIPSTVEEILRLDGPLVSMPRRATRDTEIRGKKILAGDKVSLMFMAGNRDPEAFPEAEKCLINRKGNRHLLFGAGIHFCIGAPLARLELRVALEEFLARTRHFSLKDGTPIRRFRWPGNGPRIVPLRIDPA
jgi:cytochrome P450